MWRVSAAAARHACADEQNHQPKEDGNTHLKSHMHPMFVAALFVIATYPLTDE